MAEVAKIVVKKDHAGEWRWIGYAENGEPIADSNEGYEHKDYAMKTAQDLFPDAKLEVDEAK